MFVVPKPGGRWRPIIDLSTLNLQISPPPFRMETARALRQSILPGEYAVSLDLTDAYLHIPMHRSAQRYLRFALDGTVYAFRAMPFGLNLSPWAFTRMMDSVMSAVRQVTTSSISNYLDDILQKNLSPSVLQSDLASLRRILSQLGWLVNLNKSDLVPSQRFEHLGMFFLTDVPLALPTEWELHPCVFDRLLERYPSMSLDLCATRFNAKLPRFVSPVPDPQALALDALTFDWSGEDVYAFPPFPLVPKIIARLPLCQADVTLIAPLRGTTNTRGIELGMMIDIDEISFE
nr:hypothetical protein BaRGS_009389 [Batillaria attramentaria]